MDEKQQLKAEKAVDKMLGVNKLYITLPKPLTVLHGDEISITGRVGDNEEVIAGTIQITRKF
jgi:hypothetical protein